MPKQLKDDYFSAWHLSENRADAHRIPTKLRRTNPVHDDPARQCWMLTRDNDVVSVLHPGQFMSRRLVQPARTNELAATAMILMAVGSVTTVRVLTNGLSALFQDRTHLDLLRERLQAKPEVVKGTVEELLHCVTPPRFVARWAVHDVAIGGNIIFAGQKVLVFLEAANHDLERFTAPEELELRKLPNPHMTICGGHHLCPGAALALVEAQIVFAALLLRFPQLYLCRWIYMRSTPMSISAACCRFLLS